MVGLLSRPRGFIRCDSVEGIWICIHLFSYPRITVINARVDLPPPWFHVHISRHIECWEDNATFEKRLRQTDKGEEVNAQESVV
jgi:hypothetical protein